MDWMHVAVVYLGCFAWFLELAARAPLVSDDHPWATP
jgi:hypothetical protein